MKLKIIQNIVNHSNLQNQIKCSQIDRCVNDNLLIYSLDAKNNVDQQIIKKRIFGKLKILDCRDNQEIYNVNHLANTLMYLDCSGDCCVPYCGISMLTKLEVLHCSNNGYMSSVNHLKKSLRKLYCDGSNCSINQYGISELENLEVLSCVGNIFIRNVNNFRNTLTELECDFEPDLNEFEKIRKFKKTDRRGNNICDRFAGRDFCRNKMYERGGARKELCSMGQTIGQISGQIIARPPKHKQ